MESTDRSVLLGELQESLRRANALGVLFGHEVAQRVELNHTDMECLDILTMTGPITAGRLAEVTGLTTGAITGLVDRLEERGYVHRSKDPRDRRRVIIVPNTEAMERDIDPYYASLAQRMREVVEQFSDEEVELLLEFSRASSQVTLDEIAHLRGEEPSEFWSEGDALS